MSRAALTKLWSFFALATLTFSFLSFLRTTGVQPGGDSLGVLGYKASTIPILALPLNMALFSLVLWLTWVWSESVEKGSFAQRIPIFYFEEKDVDPKSRGGRIYQRWSFVLALVVPMLLAYQMTDRFYSGAVYAKGKGAEEYTELARGEDLFNFSKLNAAEGMLRFGEPNGPTFFPLQPWLYGGLVLALTLWWLFVLRSVLRRP